jgi:hypothetical protein
VSLCFACVALLEHEPAHAVLSTAPESFFPGVAEEMVAGWLYRVVGDRVRIHMLADRWLGRIPVMLRQLFRPRNDALLSWCTFVILQRPVHACFKNGRDLLRWESLFELVKSLPGVAES